MIEAHTLRKGEDTFGTLLPNDGEVVEYICKESSNIYVNSEDNILKLVLKLPNRSIKADFLNLFLSLAQRKEEKKP